MSLGECGAVHEYYELNFGKPASTRGVVAQPSYYTADVMETGADAADTYASWPPGGGRLTRRKR